MNKSEQKYIAALLLITVIVVVIRIIQPQPVNWSESYSKFDKIPFGGYILNEQLQSLFPEDTISVNNQTLFEFNPQSPNHNLIFINADFGIDEFEAEILHEHVFSGDFVFIAVRAFEGALADTLNIQITQSFPSINPGATSLDSLSSNKVNFTNPLIKSENGWRFPVQLTESYFTSFDTTNTEVLGLDGRERVNFIRLNHGDGAYLIHTSPFLFTNYYLRNPDKYDYAFKALSYLPEQYTFWDEYYKVGRVALSSPMGYIISNDNLKMAWWIMVFGLIAYLILNGRRLQRIIPTIKPVQNTSIEFAETIANLYLENGTHKDILNKKVTFLKDYIRNNLNVNLAVADDNSYDNIAQRSGLEKAEIDELFGLIDLMEQKEQLTAKELKKITERIDRFYNQSQR